MVTNFTWRITMTSDQVVWTFEKTVSIPVSAIEKIVFDIRQGSFQTENLPFLLRDKSDCKIVLVDSTYMILFNDGHKEYITLDAVGHQVTIKGEWWYKGVYSFDKKGMGTRIQLKVFNAAERYRWAASLLLLPDKKKHASNFEIFITALEEEYLNCQGKL